MEKIEVPNPYPDPDPKPDPNPYPDPDPKPDLLRHDSECDSIAKKTKISNFGCTGKLWSIPIKRSKSVKIRDFLCIQISGYKQCTTKVQGPEGTCST